MEVIQLTRSFKIKSGNDQVIDLPDPNPAFTVQEVMDMYTVQHPSLTTAKISGPVIEYDQEVYTFSSMLGTKG